MPSNRFDGCLTRLSAIAVVSYVKKRKVKNAAGYLSFALFLTVAMVVQYTNPEIKAALTENDKKQCLDVRVKVFVDEQKYTLESEIHE